MLDANEELRGGVGGGGFDLVDLERVAEGVLTEEDEPLVAVEVAEGDVGEEVVAELGLGVGGEGDGLSAGGAELGDPGGRVRSLSGGTDDLAGDEF